MIKTISVKSVNNETGEICCVDWIDKHHPLNKYNYESLVWAAANGYIDHVKFHVDNLFELNKSHLTKALFFAKKRNKKIVCEFLKELLSTKKLGK